MKFFNLLSKQKKVQSSDRAEVLRDYVSDKAELKVLHNCRNNRATFVDRISTWNISEIEERLGEYEAETASLKSDNEIILCQIFEEKISQLKEARKRILVSR